MAAMTVDPRDLVAEANALTLLAAQTLTGAACLSFAAERRRALATALRKRERATARLLVREARAESTQVGLERARAAEDTQAARSRRADEVFAEARDGEVRALDDGADPAVLVFVATVARTAAEVAERQACALIGTRLAREDAERAHRRAARHAHKARDELARSERAVSALSTVDLVAGLYVASGADGQ